MTTLFSVKTSTFLYELSFFYKNLVCYLCTGGVDFLDFAQVVTIDEGITKACTNFLIVDDDIVMEGNETFQLDIIILLPLPVTTSTTTVTIIDDDCTYVSSIVNVVETSNTIILTKVLQMHHTHSNSLINLNLVSIKLSLFSIFLCMLPLSSLYHTCTIKTFCFQDFYLSCQK